MYSTAGIFLLRSHDVFSETDFQHIVMSAADISGISAGETASKEC